MTTKPDYSFISDILRRNAELNREAGIKPCPAFECVGGRDYTRIGGLCPWCNGTGYVKEKANG